MWRNRQTRWIQVPVVATPCGFKSHHPHQEKTKTILGFGFFLYDDVELKSHSKKGSPKIPTGFLGKRSGNEADSVFYYE